MPLTSSQCDDCRVGTQVARSNSVEVRRNREPDSARLRRFFGGPALAACGQQLGGPLVA